MPDTRVLDRLDALFAPLARLLVAQGVAFPDLAERLKGHYVRAATAQAEGKPTDSRLSVLTGLQRRDVARLKGFAAKPPRPSPLTRLVALWSSDPDYAPDGASRALPRHGPAPSFEALAKRIRKDVHPRALLDTLLEAGTAALSEDGQTVHLRQTAYVPAPGSEAQLGYLAVNVGDHLATAADNLSGQPPRFERALHYRGLTEAQARALAKEFEAGQTALLETLNRKAHAMKQDAPEGANARIRAGGYLRLTEENGG